MSSLKDSLKRIRWTSPKTFELDGLDYLVDAGGYQHSSTPERLVILKANDYWAAYVQGLRNTPVRNVLELGIWQGGSALAFSSLLSPERLATVDICDPLPVFDEIRGRHPAGGPLRVHYRTSQDDAERLNRIIAEDFDGPIHLVIDDASHDYHLTRRAFEIIFPHLAPGGVYAIEDWGWAHARNFKLWTDKPAMSNLLYQLLMVNAGRPDLISNINVFRGVAFVRKGPEAQVGEPFDLDDLAWAQGRPFQLL